jgi:hypothetical protein
LLNTVGNEKIYYSRRLSIFAARMYAAQHTHSNQTKHITTHFTLSPTPTQSTSRMAAKRNHAVFAQADSLPGQAVQQAGPANQVQSAFLPGDKRADGGNS